MPVAKIVLEWELKSTSCPPRRHELYFMYMACTYEENMSIARKHKHLVLDQRKIDAAKRYFGVDSEQEAIDKALSLLVEEQQLTKALRPLKGMLKGDTRPWPYR